MKNLVLEIIYFIDNSLPINSLVRKITLLLLTAVLVGSVTFSMLISPDEVSADIMSENDNIPSDKVWTIQFNTEMDLDSAKKQIDVFRDGEKIMHDILLSYGQLHSEIKVTSEEPYDVGESYVLAIEEELQSKNGNNMEHAMNFRFTIESPKNEETSLKDHYSNSTIEFKDQDIYFKDGTESYKLSDVDRPLLNTRLHNLATTLIGEEAYTGFTHFGAYTNESRVEVAYTPGHRPWINNSHAFSVFLYENKGYGFDASRSWHSEQFTNDAEVTLRIERLWFDSEKKTKDLTQKLYTQKLKGTIKVLYPKESEEIYQFLMQKYNDRIEDYKKHEYVPVSRTFGNVKVDVVIGNGGVNAYFSKVN